MLVLSERVALGPGALMIERNAIGFDLNQPIGINEARNFHKGAGGTYGPEHLTVRSSSLSPLLNIGQHDASANDLG